MTNHDGNKARCGCGCEGCFGLIRDTKLWEILNDMPTKKLKIEERAQAIADWFYSDVTDNYEFDLSLVVCALKVVEKAAYERGLIDGRQKKSS